MDLFSLTVGLPFAPIRGLIGIARLLQQQVEREVHDPSRIRRQLEETESAVASGELSEAEAEQAQREILTPLVGRRPPDESTTTESEQPNAEER